MLNWLKYITGSFFSNKIAKEGAHRSFWNVIFVLFMYIIIVTAFFSSGYNFSFPTHYNNANKFQEFTSHVFTQGDKINLTITNDNDNNFYADAYNFKTNEKVVINTYVSDDDKTMYLLNDYNIVIDTRDSTTTFCDFEITYTNNNDKNDVKYTDEFKLLSTEEQNNYTFAITYKPTEFIVTQENVDNVYKPYLEGYKDSEDSAKQEVYTNYEELLKNTSISTEKFNAEVYSLYIKDYEMITAAPTMLMFYQSEYSSLDESSNLKYSKFLVLTDTWALMSFESDKGVVVSFDGYYTSIDSGFSLITPQTESNIEVINNQIDTLISGIFSSVYAFNILITGMSVFTSILTIIIALALIALFMFSLCKITHQTYSSTLIGGFKIATSFLIITAAIAGITEIILSFFMSNYRAMTICHWIILSLLILRSLVFVIMEFIAFKKNPNHELATNAPINVSSNSSYSPLPKSNIDITKAKAENKVIKNEKVNDDDDDEKMEMM